jgi:hypothetical protein
MIRLEVDVLRSGTKIVRPAGALGTCGFHPKAWSVAVIGRNESLNRAFLRANPNWKPEELETA